MRLWLPDVPGTLGRVAAAIGRAGGDVIGIEILERGAGMAIDELTVTLPEGSTPDRLIDEVSDVEGVAVEDVHEVAVDRPDQSVLALDVTARIMESSPSMRASQACVLVREMLESDWCVILSASQTAPVASSGELPELAWLAAFIDGASHLSVEDAPDHTPSDIAWASLAGSQLTIVTGRSKGAFRLRERRHLQLIARIVGTAPMDVERRQ